MKSKRAVSSTNLSDETSDIRRFERLERLERFELARSDNAGAKALTY
jgi:hypothetical protein